MPSPPDLTTEYFFALVIVPPLGGVIGGIGTGLAMHSSAILGILAFVLVTGYAVFMLWVSYGILRESAITNSEKACQVITIAALTIGYIVYLIVLRNFSV